MGPRRWIPSSEASTRTVDIGLSLLDDEINVVNSSSSKNWHVRPVSPRLQNADSRRYALR